MEESIIFSNAQIELIKSTLGVQSLEGVKLKFEVPAKQSNKMVAALADTSSSITIKMCYCGDGRFSPKCC